MTEASAFTGTLVAANKKLIGATVNNLAGEPLGTVDDLMIGSTGRGEIARRSHQVRLTFHI
jgi:hypothetical protein